ncbi:MAG: O-antigen ligase family protein [Acidobacteriota bacterium]|nr:O-antigen ligase family protein [Acidobacteriota bacterium]
MQAFVADSLSVPAASGKLRVAGALGSVIFFSLLVLLVITALPYGTREAWWKALFVCAVFTLAILWLVEGYLSHTWIKDGRGVILPLLALAIFSVIQTIHFPLATSLPGGITPVPWNAISVDPYQTRFFALQIFSLILAAVFLFNYANTEKRWRILINLIIGVAVASAIFGIVRRTTQHDTGFVLPLIKLEQGYGQFINRNHFAFMMEAALGLGLGMTIGGGVRRDQALIYFAALMPIWTALVLSGSRAGLIAMLAQVIVAALLFSLATRKRDSDSESRVVQIMRSRAVQVSLVVVLLFGIVLGTLWLGGNDLASRIAESRSDLSSETDYGRRAVSRNDIWKLTLRMIAANPIVGVGMGAYWASVPTFHDGSGQMTPQEAHNDYLEVIASGGIVGLAILVWFVIVVLRKTRENLRASHRFRRAACFGAAIGITGMAVHSLVDFGLHAMINALIFIALVVMVTAKPPWATERIRETI